MPGRDPGLWIVDHLSLNDCWPPMSGTPVLGARPNPSPTCTPWWCQRACAETARARHCTAALRDAEMGGGQGSLAHGGSRACPSYCDRPSCRPLADDEMTSTYDDQASTFLCLACPNGRGLAWHTLLRDGAWRHGHRRQLTTKQWLRPAISAGRACQHQVLAEWSWARSFASSSAHSSDMSRTQMHIYICTCLAKIDSRPRHSALSSTQTFAHRSISAGGTTLLRTRIHHEP